MFKKFLFAAASVAVASAQLFGAEAGNIVDLLLLDRLSHESHYYGYDNGLFHDLLPLLAFGGFPNGNGGEAGPMGTIHFEEYLLWQDLVHGTHSHGGIHGKSDVLPLMALGIQGGMSTFDSMIMIHEYQIAQDYDNRWLGGDGILGALAMQDFVTNGRDGSLLDTLHNFHVIEGVADHRHNGNGADLVPLAFLTGNGDQDVMMENLHHLHYFQNWGNGHNDFIPWSILGLAGGNSPTGNLWNTQVPISEYWAIDQILNGDDYHHNDHGHGHGHHDSHHGSSHHGSHHGSSHHGSHHGSSHHGSHHGSSHYYAAPAHYGYSRHAPIHTGYAPVYAAPAPVYAAPAPVYARPAPVVGAPAAFGAGVGVGAAVATGAPVVPAAVVGGVAGAAAAAGAGL